MTENKTHYRRAFDSPYLSSADIVEPTILTIKCVRLESDKTKKTKDMFNTAYFVEKFLQQDEILKPMILNAINSKTMANMSQSKFIDDWNNIPVMIYVDPGVRFGRDVVEGLRIRPEAPKMVLPELQPGTRPWENAIAAYKRDGNLDKVKARMTISELNERLLIEEANLEAQK